MIMVFIKKKIKNGGRSIIYCGKDKCLLKKIIRKKGKRDRNF